MQEIKSDNSMIKATVAYSSNMSASAVASSAHRPAQGLERSHGQDVPTSVNLLSATVTKKNVDPYPLGAFS